MDRIRRIKKSINYIEDHLFEKINVIDAAEAACFSRYHFSRVFSQLTRHTPYEYIMKRKLSEAALAIKRKDMKVIEAAYQYEFQSPEGFSRAFKRFFGFNPKEIRKKKLTDIPVFKKIDGPMIHFIKNNKPYNCKTKNKRLWGLMTRIDCPDSPVIDELWKVIGGSHDGSRQRKIGVYIRPLPLNNAFFYFAGVLCGESEMGNGALKPGLFFEIPEFDCLVFHSLNRKDYELAKRYSIDFQRRKPNIEREERLLFWEEADKKKSEGRLFFCPIVSVPT